jgi:propanol-preferring alcohol dehydrogenase
MEALQGKVNKAIIYSNPGTRETEVVELPIEAPGPGQVLVRMYVYLDMSLFMETRVLIES